MRNFCNVLYTLNVFHQECFDGDLYQGLEMVVSLFDDEVCIP